MIIKESIKTELARYILNWLNDQKIADDRTDIQDVQTLVTNSFKITNTNEAKTFIKKHYDDDLLKAINDLHYLWIDFYGEAITGFNLETLNDIVNGLASGCIDKMIADVSDKSTVRNIKDVQYELLTNLF